MFTAFASNESIIDLDLGNRLILNKNKIGCSSMLSLGNAISTNRTLIYLNLSGNTIGNEGFELLIPGVQANNTLLEFNISANHITDTELMAKLFLNHSIIDMDISSNAMQNTGLYALSVAITKNITIVNIHVSDMGFECIF